MIYSEEPVLSTIEAIYSASTDPTRWSAALGEMADLFGACASTLLHRNLSDGGIVFAASGMDPHLIELYDQYYWAHDLTLKVTETAPVGTFASSDRVCSTKTYERSELVADLLLPNDLYRIGGSVLIRSEKTFASLGLHRPKNAPDFDDIQELYMEIQPHIQRSLTITQKLQRVSAERDALAHSLDHLNTGVVVLDGNGRVILANRSATEIAAEGDGFSLTPNGPAAATLTGTALLRQQIGEASKTAVGGGFGSGGTVLLDRPSGQRSYEVLVAPLKDPEALGSDRRGRVALFVSDPDRTTTPPTEWLRHLHGFTEAESRLVLSLANGASLTETAENLTITRNTARTHLQRALLKTDTNRQGELIRRVLSGPAGLVNGSKRP